MNTTRTWDLQLLAEGGDGASPAAGTETGVSAGDAGLPERLAELGVPQGRIEKRRRALERKSAPAMRRQEDARTDGSQTETPKAAEAEPQPEAGNTDAAPAAQDAQPGEQVEAAPAVTRESLLADPATKKILDDYANEIVRARVKATGQEAESFRKLRQALPLLATYYGLDANNPDLEALSQKIVSDNAYYEDRALAEGKDVEEVKRASVQAMRQQQLQEQTMRQHFELLRQQGEALKQKYPGFDLGVELRNPVFARMVGPGSLVPLEDAYYAVHRQEIQAAQQEAAQKAAMEAASRSIQAGQARPVENGSAQQTAAVPTVNIKDKAYREELKRRIREAAARGEYIRPGS